METLHGLLASLKDLLNDLPGHLTALSVAWGPWTYAALFAVIFCETGLIVLPLLPGDSLLFALGTLCAADGSYLDPVWLAAVLWTAAVSGDCVNYSVGRAFGKSRFVNVAHLRRTQAFFERHGAQTIVLARFAPILRTYAPFVAGLGRMRLGRFVGFSAAGGAAWIGSFLAAGYFFGNVPAIKSNFHLAILAIALVSLLPAAVEFTRARLASSPVRPSPAPEEL